MKNEVTQDEISAMVQQFRKVKAREKEIREHARIVVETITATETASTNRTTAGQMADTWKNQKGSKAGKDAGKGWDAGNDNGNRWRNSKDKGKPCTEQTERVEHVSVERQ